jgi:hypothetical protein
MPFRIYWNLREAIFASVTATLGTTLIALGLPGLHVLALPLAWLILGGLMYQTGCELFERARIKGKPERSAPEG